MNNKINSIGVSNIPRVMNRDSPAETLKKGIWVYFVLLIIEGGLRKWVFPGYATPLLIIRDPVAIWLIIYAWNYNLMVFNRFVYIAIFLGIAGTITAVLVGHGNLFVAVYGARILLLHFPLIFLIGKIFERNDVLKIGKVLMYMSVPMTILIALQFYSPQSAWVNRGIGGEEGLGFTGALGFFRPPATFSFISGTAQFYGLVTCYVIYFWLNIKECNRILLIAATICVLGSIPLSISRALFFGIALSVLLTGFAVLNNSKYLKSILWAVGGVVILAILLINTPMFQKAIEAITTRFSNASDSEGSIANTLMSRVLGESLGAIVDSFEQPFFGKGLGMGTNAGAKLLTGDSTVFLVAEGEWGRIMGEMGILMGLAFLYIRLAIVWRLALFSYKKIAMGDLLPWLLLSFAFPQIIQGQWAQPTSLGFAVLGSGLIIAAFKTNLPDGSTPRGRITRDHLKNVTFKEG